MSDIYKWNGSSWVMNDVYKWNGSSWVQATVYKWNGSSWIQIYPDVAKETTKTITPGNNVAQYRSGYKSWTQNGRIAQGYYNGPEGLPKSCHGYCAVYYSQFTGYGNCTSVSSATFSGTRTSSGNYNASCTHSFKRLNGTRVVSHSGVAIEGTSTFNTGGGNKSFSGKSIGTGIFKNLINNSGSRGYLYLANNETGAAGGRSWSANYLGITGVSFTIKYKYEVSRALFVNNDMETYTFMSTRNAHTNRDVDIYHDMLIYNEEKNMSLNDIIERRTELNLDDIRDDEIFVGDDLEIPGSHSDTFTDTIFKVKLLFMKEHYIPYLLLENGNRKKMIVDNDGNFFALHEGSNKVTLQIEDINKDMIILEEEFYK